MARRALIELGSTASPVSASSAAATGAANGTNEARGRSATGGDIDKGDERGVDSGLRLGAETARQGAWVVLELKQQKADEEAAEAERLEATRVVKAERARLKALRRQAEKKASQVVDGAAGDVLGMEVSGDMGAPSLRQEPTLGEQEGEHLIAEPRVMGKQSLTLEQATATRAEKVRLKEARRAAREDTERQAAEIGADANRRVAGRGRARQAERHAVERQAKSQAAKDEPVEGRQTNAWPLETERLVEAKRAVESKADVGEENLRIHDTAAVATGCSSYRSRKGCACNPDLHPLTPTREAVQGATHTTIRLHGAARSSWRQRSLVQE